MSNRRPVSPFRGSSLDEEIQPLIAEFASKPAFETLGSCSGHGRENAYLEFAVDGLAGLRAFVKAADEVDARIGDRVMIDVGLNWSREVWTGCRFEEFPEWIMLTLTIEGADGPPTTEELSLVSVAFAAAFAAVD